MRSEQKVLIVDDEPRNQRIITETLEGLFILNLASSGEEALESVKKDPPDLVFLDIMMPGISGYDVCSQIRLDPKLQFTKVVLVSGKAMIDERLKGYEVGADDYMTKPFVPEELLAKAKVFLRLSQMEKELKEINQSLDGKVQEKARLLLEAEAKLMNSAKMSALGEMAGGMAHEINTPLTTIMLMSEQQAEMLSEEPIEKDNLRKGLQIISAAANNISKIVQGLRFFSRDSSLDPFVKSDLSKIIGDTILLCAERFKVHDIRLEIETNPVTLACRPVQIAQVILNLLNNAYHAVEESKAEKWVKISVQDINGWTELSVMDSGSGISPEVREKLFQPFFTTKEIGKGTGLGLSISKGIIESHKGTLVLDDKSAHTRFVVRIPSSASDARMVG